MSVLAKFASVMLLAVSIGGCNQTINPHGGPVATSLPGAGLFVEVDCVARDIAIPDPVTGEPKSIHQRFCGGSRVSATDRSAMASLTPKVSAHKSSTPGIARGSSTPAHDAQVKKNSPPAKPPAQTPETSNSPPAQEPQ
jgi:hypothetical protein